MPFLAIGTFCAFLGTTCYGFIVNSNMADSWDYNVGEKIDKVRKIRNKASHKEVIDIDKMHTTRETVIGENDNSNNKIGIVPYMNDLLR